MKPPPHDPDLLTDQMLSARWYCSSFRVQYWHSHGIGISYAKMSGKVLYRLEEHGGFKQAPTAVLRRY